MKHSLCQPRQPPTHRACHCESRAQTNLSEGAGAGLRRRSRALRLQEVIDEKLQPPLALIFVDVQPVDQMQRALREGECRFAADLVEGNGIEGAAGPRELQPQFEVSVPDHAGAADGEHAIETRLGEGLSPGAAGTQRMRRIERDLLDGQLTIGLDGIARAAPRGPRGDFLIEGTREEVEPVALEGEARRHGVPAEFRDELRMARIDAREHVPNVDARRRARRTAQLPLARDRKGDYGPADVFLDTARHEPDDALVPALIEEADAASLECARTG